MEAAGGTPVCAVACIARVLLQFTWANSSYPNYLLYRVTFDRFVYMLM